MQVDLPEKTTETWTWTKLCSAFNEEASLACDLAAAHDGPHKATLLWNGEDEDDA